MAHTSKLEKEKAATKRSNIFAEEFTVQVNSLAKFYRLVQLLNLYFGHGNWTTAGRPLRKLRRVEHFNKNCLQIIDQKAYLPNRTLDITFKYPAHLKTYLSRIFLELL
jgi:hypothetical protein